MIGSAMKYLWHPPDKKSHAILKDCRELIRSLGLYNWITAYIVFHVKFGVM